MSKQRIVVPSEIILAQMKEQIVGDLKKEFKKQGITGWRFIDMEWSEEGVIVYMDIPSTGPQGK